MGNGEAAENTNYPTFKFAFEITSLRLQRERSKGGIIFLILILLHFLFLHNN